MQCISTSLDGVFEIRPVRHLDDRGYFSETFRANWFEENVSRTRFVQENLSFSRAPGVVRGLHFQSPPYAQGKLVQCVSGSMFDVAVDIRKGSATFGKWVGVTINSEEGNQLWIPQGFLHGFCTLEPDTIVTYRVTEYYRRENDLGVRWNDPDIGIEWPTVASSAGLSEKDKKQPFLKDLPTYFTAESEIG